MVDEDVDRLADGAEPEAVVDHLGPARLELTLELELRLREDQVLEGAVGVDEHHRRRGLVDLAALDADGPVLDHVDPADPVRPGRLVELPDEREQRQLLAVQRDR